MHFSVCLFLLCFVCLFVFCFVSVHVCVIYLRVVCFCTSVVTSFQFFCTAAVENYLYAHNLVFHWSHSWKNFWILNYCLLLLEGFDPPRKGLRSLFTRLNERRYDIIFLQETYSIVDVEDIWRTQWRGKLFFAHGSNHSCGVMTLVRSDLDFNSGQELKLKTCISTSDTPFTAWWD